MQEKKKSKPKKKKSQGNRRRRVWPWGVTIALLIVGFAAVYIPFGMRGAPQDGLILIPRGADNQTLSDSLTKYFGHEYSGKTMSMVKLMGSDISDRNGAYLIKEGTGPITAARQLARGAQAPVSITINAFRDLNSLEQRVAKKMEFSAEELAGVLDNDSLCASYGLTREQILALFINDTYDFYWNASPQAFVEKIGKHYNEVWNESRRKKAADLGMTPAEVMILCSIVDEETNAQDEKGRIGRLYWNRLQRGMKLQADPTIRYALGDFTIKRVKGEHLAVNSPYNTYKHAGLPPGPIRTTSVATIDAFLDSQPSEDIYMCADEKFTGHHNFAATYEEHMANARRYQAALDSIGIK